MHSVRGNPGAIRPKTNKSTTIFFRRLPGYPIAKVSLYSHSPNSLESWSFFKLTLVVIVYRSLDRQPGFTNVAILIQSGSLTRFGGRVSVIPGTVGIEVWAHRVAIDIRPHGLRGQ